MANLNSVVVVGRLTRDPELRYAANGAPVCSFGLATSQKYVRDGGEKAEATTFLDIDAWRRLAEVCAQFLKKGREVLVMGSLRQSRWVDAKTNQRRTRIKIVAHNVQFLWKREDAEGGASGDEEEQEVDAPEPAEA